MRPPPRIRARLNDSRASTNSYDLDAPYSSLTGRGASTGRRSGLVGYFKGRKAWWWVWGVVRLGCLVLVVVFMGLLVNNFYANGGGHCSWCRYLRYHSPCARWFSLLVLLKIGLSVIGFAPLRNVLLVFATLWCFGSKLIIVVCR